jgi:hypothetical protein
MVKSGKTKFQRELKEAENEGNESDIQSLWRAEIKKTLGTKAKIISKYNTDGILTFNDIHTLLEFKDKKGFKNKRIRCSVIMQALFYLHNIMEAKDKVPSTIFVGDGSECFFLHTQVLADYLNKRMFAAEGQVPNIDWSVAPSQASIHNVSVLDHMEKDKKLDNTLVIDVQGDTFRVKDIFPILEEFSKNAGQKIKIDEHNLISAFQYFKDGVVKSKQQTLDVHEEKKRVSRLIDVFYNCITDRKTTMPNRDGDIVTRGEVIQVHKKQYEAFFKLFEQDNYSISEKEKLVSVKDQVLEEISRRMTGAYFTPDLWIAKAHEMIAEQFGVDWKEKYVVWDCASGTNNLTRKYQFKELYNSTLEQGDVDTVMDMGYPGTNFQYDFLNDDVQKLPEGLKKALTEKKPILFLINPPYGTAGGKISGKGENKCGISTKSLMNIVMKSNGVGACADQLYAQFLYRIITLKKEYVLRDINIGIFSTPLFISGENYAKFRDVFYTQFSFKDGMLFQADQFADVSNGWGISFTIWDGNAKCN